MKRILQVIYLVLIYQASYSQNYQSINPNVISHFGTNYYPIQIEDITFSNDTTYFHNFDMIRYENNSLRISSNWTGKKIILTPDGNNTFINKNGQPIKIKTLANIGDTWHFFEFPNGEYIEGKIESINLESFLNLNDNVKKIVFQRKNADGSNISDTLNNYFIKISENYGFTRIINFYEYPYENVENEYYYPFSPEMDLVGYDNYGFQNFQSDDIFNYGINDEIHTVEHHQYPSDCPGVCETTEEISMKINSKYISQNLDTIIYYTSKCRRYYEWDNLTDEENYIENDTIILSKPENRRLDNVNFKPYFNSLNNTYTITALIPNKKWIKAIFSGSDANNIQEIFHNDTNIETFQYQFSDTYYNGLGGIYFFEANLCWCSHSNDVVYYKKNGIEWGTPLDCPGLGIENLSLYHYSIYPNPTTGIFKIENYNNEIKTISVYDIQGKDLILYIPIKEVIEVDLRNYLSGFYLINLTFDDKQTNLKLIKI